MIRAAKKAALIVFSGNSMAHIRPFGPERAIDPADEAADETGWGTDVKK